MDARREQRVNKAAGIPHQDVPRPVQRLAAIGPVPHYLRGCGHTGVGQHCGGVRRGGDLRFQKARRPQIADTIMAGGGVGHGAHAGPAVAQGDVPQPAAGVRFNQNVAVIRRRQPLPAPIVGVHRQVAKEIVPLPQSQLTGEQAALPAGVHHELGRQFGIAAGGISNGISSSIGGGAAAHGNGAPGGVKDHAASGAALAHRHAGAPGVVQQDGVKFGAPDLVRRGVAGVGFAEVPAPGRPVDAPDHRGAPLDGKAGPRYGIQRAQFPQDGDAGRQQRFADMRPRKPFPFQQHDGMATAGQQGADASAGGAAADDDDGVLRRQICPLHQVNNNWRRRETRQQEVAECNGDVVH